MTKDLTLAALFSLLALPMLGQNWTGAINSDWNNSGNWSDWPLSGEDIDINGAALTGAQAMPTISSASVFVPDRMFVLNGAVLTIAANLSVDDRLIVSDGAEAIMTGGTLSAGRVIMELGGLFTLESGTVNALDVFALGDDGATVSRFVQNGGTVNASGEFGFDVEVGISAPRYDMNGGTLAVNGDAVWFGAAPGGGQGALVVHNGTAQINGSLVNTLGSTVDVLVEVHGGSLTINGPGIDLAHATDSIVLSGGAFHVDGNCVVQNDGVLQAVGGATYFEQQAELRGVGSYRFNHVTISSGASLQHTDPAEIGVAGDWNALGTFDPDVNTVAFAGATGQTLLGTTFHGMRVANTGAGLTLSGPSSVAGALNLESGVVHTTGTDLLTLLDNATSSSGSSASHVDGPLRKIGNDAFVFPVGKDGQWRRIGISAVNDQDTEFTAEFFAMPFSNTTSLGPGLVSLSTLEHWTLLRAGSGDEARVELFWEDAAASGISDCENMSTAFWDGSAWQPTLSSTSGSCAGNDAGSVDSDTAIPEFNALTFGWHDGAIGIPELDGRIGLFAYPNPANDRITITGINPNAVIEVFDALGGRVAIERANAIDARAWAEGVYFLKVEGVVQRIVVQH